MPQYRSTGGAAPKASARRCRNSSLCARNAVRCARCQPRSSVRRSRASTSELASNMHALPQRIDEYRRDDAGAHRFTSQRIGADDFLVQVREPALIQPECDEPVELRGPGYRSDVAAAVSGNGLAARKQDRATAQACIWLDALDADETPAVGGLEIDALAQFAANERLVLRRHPA